MDDKRRWLYAAVDPETNKFLYVRPFPTRTTQLTMLFLRELQQRVPVTHAAILVDNAHHLKSALSRLGLRFRYVAAGIGMLSNVSSEGLKPYIFVFKYIQPCAADDSRTVAASLRCLVEPCLNQHDPLSPNDNQYSYQSFIDIPPAEKSLHRIICPKSNLCLNRPDVACWSITICDLAYPLVIHIYRQRHLSAVVLGDDVDRDREIPFVYVGCPETPTIFYTIRGAAIIEESVVPRTLLVIPVWVHRVDCL